MGHVRIIHLEYMILRVGNDYAQSILRAYSSQQVRRTLFGAPVLLASLQFRTHTMIYGLRGHNFILKSLSGGKQIPKTISMFMWRLLNKALPLEDNVIRYKTLCPTICLFCKMQSANVNHIFLHCLYVKEAWMRLSWLLDGPVYHESQIRTFLM